MAATPSAAAARRFNTQPPEGGWINQTNEAYVQAYVSTHSRLKAAGDMMRSMSRYALVSTHSRLKAAGQSTKPTSRATAFQHTAA